MALLRVGQVAKKLNFSESWVRKMVDANEIPHLRIGGSLRFDEEALDAWVAEKSNAPKETSE